MPRISGEEYRTRLKYIDQQVSRSQRPIEIVSLSSKVCSKFDVQADTANGYIEKYCLEKLKQDEVDIRLSDQYLQRHPTGIAARWHRTRIGDRLEDGSGMKEKYRLAEEALNLLETNDHMSSLVMSSGTTAYAIADRMFQHKQRLPVRMVYTISLPILDAFLAHKPHDIRLTLLSGEFDVNTGALKNMHENKELQKHKFEAVIASFSGMSSTAFYVDEEWEQSSMEYLLQQGPRCELVIIPLEWDKINNGIWDGATEIHGGLPIDYPTKKKCKRYVIVTNPPTKEKLQDRDHSDQVVILTQWLKKGGEVKYVWPL